MGQVDSTLEPVVDLTSTSCCIVGAGPGGVLLALLLARQGIAVTLLEAQQNFEREFRGDSVNPQVMEIMDQLGLVERLQQLRHAKIHKVTMRTAQGEEQLSDYACIRSKFPYVTVLPQARFLDFLTQEALRYPTFRCIMGAKFQELREKDGKVIGVRYRDDRGVHDIQADVTVGADGRTSRVRRMAGIELESVSPPVFDVLWFRLPRKPEDANWDGNLGVYFGKGYYFALTDRFDYWQIAYVIPKDGFEGIREQGIEKFQESISALVPQFGSRVAELREWSDIRLLPVKLSRVRRWYRAGLLLIGDAAHVMSSMGGVGINCAAQDAVVAANVLSEPLRTGTLTTAHLAKVQRKRVLPTRIMQMLQGMAERKFAGSALDTNQPFRLSPLLRIPFVQTLAARIIALGVWRVKVQETSRRAA